LWPASNRSRPRKGRPAPYESGGRALDALAVMAVKAAHTGEPARPTVVIIGTQVDTFAAAIRLCPGAGPARPAAAIWGLVGTDISAGAAVVAIPVQQRTFAVADDGAFDAPVPALTIDARADLIWPRVIAKVVAGTAVAEVTGKVVASIATTSLAAEAAVIGPTIGTQLARVAVAGMASTKAPRPLRPRALIAEGLAGVRPAGARGPQRQRGEESADEGGAEPTE